MYLDLINRSRCKKHDFCKTAMREWPKTYAADDFIATLDDCQTFRIEIVN
jgi:hypothetical protein